MKIFELRYFLTVAEVGSFSLEAKRVGLKASTLSRAISRFEDALGVTLLERGHFGIRLTSGCHYASRPVIRQRRWQDNQPRI
ncbi:LysR family transcriptional regulator [Nguyenibacter sp. L1]|uniref:helix-turn-helix domain-containing protein n=1 Tax=Nguyenibacter sp. L1 TaxID=3049350 RepID=UPI0038CFE74D